MVIKFEHPALDEPIMVEARYEVCPLCQGHGKHERRDIDCSRLVDEMREDGDDWGLEQYFKGAYDTICTECKGQRVILVPELPEEIQEKIWEYNDGAREYAAEVAAERRMGA